MKALYLSRLSINRKAPVRALSQLLNPNDPNKALDAHHRLIWTLFSDRKDRQRDFLWRHAGKGKFYVLSTRPPVENDLFLPPDTKEFSPELSVGSKLSFLLRANATKERSRATENRRVDIVMDVLHKVPAEERAAQRMECAGKAARDWMERQAATKGFFLAGVSVEDYSVRSIRYGQQRKVNFGILDIIGEIEVTEPELFVSSLAQGFGRAKSWGCGLMMIKRIS